LQQEYIALRCVIIAELIENIMPINYKKCASDHEKESCKSIVNKFFAYYTHNNLYYDNCEEFCDALVIFEDYNLVFQMKSLQNKRITNYNENLKKGIKQINQNYQFLQNPDKAPIYIGKGKKDRKNFDKNLGKKTFYILLMDGMWDWIKDGLEGLSKKIEDSGDYKDPEKFRDEFKKYEYLLGLNYPDNLPEDRLYSKYFIFNSKEYFEKTLKHCSSIKDFVDFLEFTALAMERRIIVPHDEALLHCFILGDRQIINQNYDIIILDESCNLEDQRIKDKLVQEEDSVQIIDRNLIDLFSYEQNTSKVCSNSELAIRELVSLNRSQRVGLTNLILKIQLEQGYLGIFFREDRNTVYCVSHYSEQRKGIYRLDTPKYIHNILYPHLCYKLSLQSKLPNKVIFIVYEKYDNSQCLRTLTYIEGLPSDQDITNGQEIERILNSISRQ
jgi:hypothetical protein